MSEYQKRENLLPEDFVEALCVVAGSDSNEKNQPRAENASERKRKKKADAVLRKKGNKMQENIRINLGLVETLKKGVEGEMVVHEISIENENDEGLREISPEMPNPEGIEGSRFTFESEKQGDLKNSKEVGMAHTESEALEYNEKKLKAEDVERAGSIEELLQMIDASEGIQGSKEYFDKDKLKMIIKMVQNKEVYNGQEISIEYITRSGGLRQKVFDLLQDKSIPVLVEEVKSSVPPLEKEEEESVVLYDENPRIISRRTKEREIKEKPIEKPKEVLTEKPKEVLTQKPANFSIISKGGVEFPSTENPSVYNPEDFMQEDPEFLRVPGGRQEFSLEDLPDLDNLPEVPGVSGGAEYIKTIFAEDYSFDNSDNGKEYDKDIKALEKELLKNRASFVLAHKEVSAQKEKYKKNPFKKFLIKAFGIGAKKNQEILNKNENIRKLYEEKFLKLVKEKSLKETDRILSLHANSAERKKYESVTDKDLKEFISENEDLRDSLEEYDRYEGVTLSTLLSSLKGLSKEKKEEYRTKFISKKVLKEINPEMIKNEEYVIEKLLNE